MLTQERLKELLTYNADTGIFYWKERLDNLAFNNLFAGKQAGTVDVRSDRTNYAIVKIRLSDKVYRAHRLVWLYIYGKFPQGEIDHINGNTLDN